MVIEALKQIDWSQFNPMVACSGGLDSTVLIHGLYQLGIQPKLLHVNYHLRGTESNEDEAIVTQLAHQLNLEIQIEHCPKDLVLGDGINLQAAARDFRRNLFQDWNSKSPQNCVVLGHHEDDQVETFWNQLMRGNSIFGLGGMRMISDQLVRPFLTIPKSELLRFAQENNISWREDRSNSENKYTRNKFRNVFIPLLNESNSAINQHVLVLQNHFRNQQDELIQSTQTVVLNWKKDESIELEIWKKWNENEQLAALKQFKWPFWIAEKLNNLAVSELSSYFQYRDLVIYKTKHKLSWRTDLNENTPWDYKSEAVQELPKTIGSTEIFLNEELLFGQLNWRFAEVTDWISPIGMTGKQNVLKVLKDAGIPTQLRNKVIVLCDDQHVHWIPGIKISRLALANSSTTKLIRVWRTKQHD